MKKSIKATEKQLELIADMQEFGGCPVFNGKTKYEANDYIDQNIELYRISQLTEKEWSYE